MTPARILLVDDHDLLRQGLASLIMSQPDLEVVGQAQDGFEALKLVRDLQPDLIVMDINMPVCDGLEATRLIRTEFPQARIVVLTVHDEDENLFHAIEVGACGYILKNTSSADFLRGLRGALAGEAPVSPRLAARLLDEFNRLSHRAATPSTSGDDAPDLTAREREILQLVAGGLTDKEIAAQLSISMHTVKSHIRNILSKLHAANRREAARLAMKHGIVHDGSQTN